MKIQALILLIVFLTASVNQAYCCGTHSDIQAPSEKGKLELCEKHSCCSTDDNTQNDSSESHHDTCKCLHLPVMNAAASTIFEEVIDNNFDHQIPSTDQWLSRLIYKEIFQPPKLS